MEDSSQSSKAEVKFNIGLIYAERMQRLVEKANLCAAMGRYEIWKDVLDTLGRELFCKMNKDQRKKTLEFVETTDVIYKGYNSKKLIQIGQRVTTSISIPKKFMDKLRSYDIFLRDVMNEHGFMPDKPDMGEAAYG